MRNEYHKFQELGILKLHGRLDTMESAKLKETLFFYLQDSKRLLLDLDRVNYMDSSGLRAILFGLKKAIGVDGDIRLANIPPQVKMILELTRANQLFKSYQNTDSGYTSWSSELQKKGER